MPLLTLIFALAVIGLAMYLINRYIPMEPKIRTIMNWVVAVIVVIWLLQLFGLWAYLGVFSVPRAK